MTLEEYVASLTPRGLAWGPARLAGFTPPEGEPQAQKPAEAEATAATGPPARKLPAS